MSNVTHDIQTDVEIRNESTNKSHDTYDSPIHNVWYNEELNFRILDYCDETSRTNVIILSSAFHKILTSEISFKWRLECLHRERGIYYPNNRISSSWRDMFIKNWKRRNLFVSGGNLKGRMDCDGDQFHIRNPKGRMDCDSDQFHIQVSARFKPRNIFNPNSNVTNKKIVLPLHQRLALIQMSNGLKSKKEAFEILVQQGSWFGDAVKGSINLDDDIDERDDIDLDNGITKGKTQSIRGGVHLIDPHKNCVVLVDKIKGLRKFVFDNVFEDNKSQEYVYQKTVMPLITEFINGFNVSCIVYGQTGSGKTHMMFGPRFDFNFKEIYGPSPSWGIVQRSCYEVFQAIEYRKRNLNLLIDSYVTVSYVEIFGDTVSDLLRNGKSCGQNKVTAQRYVLDGSSEFNVESLSDTLHLLSKGEKQKRKAATAMNDRSSRAHSIFIITLKQKCQNTGVTAISRLFLADLGGSEQLKKSLPHDYGNEQDNIYERKQRVREAVNINLGLLALKQCVEALRKKKKVPYADSKLTMMLSSGLGGDSKTAVIVCGAQEEQHGTETIGAMKFGQICKGISNAATANANMLQELLQTINQSINECEMNIKKYERWETRDVKHFDDQGNLVDVKKVTAVVGAEKFREQLSVLLRQKMELTGDSIDSLYATDSELVEGFGNAHVYGLGKKVGSIEIGN